MQQFTNFVHRGVRLIGAVLLLLPATLAWTSVAHATTIGSVYSYTLDGSISTISNGAAANTAVNLNLLGDWNQSTYGVHFDGDTVSKQSVGYAKPASGDTLNVPATSSIGTAVRFKFQTPASTNCDSLNISQ